MGTEDSQNINEGGEPNAPGAGAAPASEPEERGSKMNAAKAFYRAMFAGEDVAPDDFGLAANQSKSNEQSSGPCPNCARLEAQSTELQQQKTEAENLYKRMAADFENYRRRLDKEREEFLSTGMQKAVENILPALDDMDRARMSLVNISDPKAMLESFGIVFARFSKCLDNMGIKQLDAVGQQFDPRLHEPVQEIETNEFPDGAVMHELRKGYSHKDKILRPTLVNVASNPSGIVVEKAVQPEVETAIQSEISTTAETEGPSAPPASSTPEAPPAPEPVPASTAAIEPATAQAAQTYEEPKIVAPAAVPESTTIAAAAREVASQPTEVKPTNVIASALMEAQAEVKKQPESQEQRARALERQNRRVNPSATADLPAFRIEEYESLMKKSDEDGGNSPKSDGDIYDLDDLGKHEGKNPTYAETTAKQVLDE